jgi:hypothetical protein
MNRSTITPRRTFLPGVEPTVRNSIGISEFFYSAIRRSVTDFWRGVLGDNAYGLSSGGSNATPPVFSEPENTRLAKLTIGVNA